MKKLSPILYLVTQSYTIKLLLIFALSSLINLFLVSPVLSQAINSSEEYFFRINNFPSQTSNSWGNGDWAPSGLAHTTNSWVIASGRRDLFDITGNLSWKLWKIPSTVSLNSNLDINSNVITWENQPVNDIIEQPFGSSLTSNYFLTTFTEFQQYGHVGDIVVCYDDDNEEYLLVPLYGHSVYMDSTDPVFVHHQVLLANSPQTAIAFFRASNLEFISYAYLAGGNQDNVGWCAVNSADGLLYTSPHSATKLLKYEIDWPKVKSGDPNHEALSLKSYQPKLMNSSGTDTIELFDMQGGEFSPTGDLLYTSSGIVDCWLPGGDDHHPYIDGIHVFRYNAPDWVLVTQSSNSTLGIRSPSCFDFNFDSNGCYGDEPEGLTIWDLDGKSVPGCGGQLHVQVDGHNTPTIEHFQNFKCPNSINVFANSSDGVNGIDIDISNFLLQGLSPTTCATSSNDFSSPLHPGVNPITFSINDGTAVNVQCTANINVIAKNDIRNTAFPLYKCQEKITNNYGANNEGSNYPVFSNYTGTTKDVWFKIDPPFPLSFSIETYQIPNGLTNTVMQVLMGTNPSTGPHSCENFIEIASDDTSGEGNHSKVVINNLTSTCPIYVRVTDYGGDDYAYFGIEYQGLAPDTNIFIAEEFHPDGGPWIQYDETTVGGDINGDGKMDLVLAGNIWEEVGHQVISKISNGDGSYNFIDYQNYDTVGVPMLNTEYVLTTGDINGDGKSDVVLFHADTATYTIFVKVKLSNGNGSFTPVPTLDSNAVIIDSANQIYLRSMKFGDINGDGKMDLVFIYHGNDSSSTITVRTKFSNGDGTFSSIENNVGGNKKDLENIFLDDINGDGKTDLVFVYYGNTYGTIVQTQISNGNGTFLLCIDTLGDMQGVIPTARFTGDVNGDGKTDLIFRFHDPTKGLTIRTKMSNGNGTFTAYEEVIGWGFNYAMTFIGDVNGDGMSDITFAIHNLVSCNLNIIAEISKGDGTWCTDWQGMPDGYEIYSDFTPIMGDINNDGKADLVFPFFDADSGLVIRTKIAKSNYVCIQTNLPLASSLKNFMVTEYNCNTLLAWATLQEENTSHIDIYRKSSKQKTFSKIATVQSAGYSNQEKSYNYVDKNVVSNETYEYQLKFIDIDGQVQQSEIKALTLACNEENTNIKIFPNPANNELNVLYVTESNNSEIEIAIYDLTGRNIISKTQSLTNGGNLITLDISKLSNGIYLLHYKNIDTMESGSIKFEKR